MKKVMMVGFLVNDYRYEVSPVNISDEIQDLTCTTQQTPPTLIFGWFFFFLFVFHIYYFLFRFYFISSSFSVLSMRVFLGSLILQGGWKKFPYCFEINGDRVVPLYP